MSRPLFCALALALGITRSLAAQTSPPLGRDVLHGHISVDSGKPIAGATVTVTMAPDRSYRQTQTDSSGYYEIVFAHGTGDYLVHAVAPGMDAARKRVTRSGRDSVFVVDLHLARAGAQQLAAVNVRTSKPKLYGGADFHASPGPGVVEHDTWDGVVGSIAPDLAGNLAAMLITTPGTVMTAGGTSVAGLDPGQNGATLNGLGFAGADLPRSAITYQRITTSTYEPARGWFGGAQEQIELADDVIASIRTAHLTLDAPAFQYADPTSRALGQPFTRIMANIGGADRTHLDKVAYNYGITASRQVDQPVSLFTAPGLILSQSGIPRDSVARLETTLSSLGLTTPGNRDAGTRASDRLTFVGQIGNAPSNWATFEDTKTTWTILGYGSIDRQNVGSLVPTAAPSASSRPRDRDLALQGHLMSHVRDNLLAEGTTGISLSHHETVPTSRIPAATLLLASTTSGDTSATTLVPIAIGGATTQPRIDRWTWETTGDVKLYPANHPTHRLKLSVDARVDGSRLHQLPSLGAFTFQSIDDLAANRPSSFTRLLNAPDQSGRVANAFVALGDWWRVGESLEFLYGLRLEGTRYLTTPGENDAVQSAFGIRTDHAPNGYGLSPRFGFTWTHSADTYQRDLLGVIGQFPRFPSGTLRGGFGEFRSFMAPDLIAATSAQTGLPNGESTLACVGSGTPIPTWSSYITDPNTTPTSCANGAPPAFASTGSSVALFDPAYRTPHSWRGNLSYTSSAWHVNYVLDGFYSLNVDQPGRVDLNINKSPVFVTDEGRPVFVAPESIVPASGVVASADARRTTSFGHIFDNVSTNRSINKRATLTLSPELSNLGSWFTSVSYSLASTRERITGFDGATFGSPATREWGRSGFDARHQIMLHGGVYAHHMTFTMFGTVQSGLPFTPLISGDVNGDGLSNDRAFIYDPATTSDAKLASGMGTLLRDAQPATRDCLERQLGHAADRNSCDGPWTARLDAQVTYYGKLTFGRRGSVALHFANALGGLDQLIHGADHLHGWGTFATPDPVLYSVRGFDLVTHRFDYAVNSRFGDTRANATTVRAPFRVTLDISVNLAPDPYESLVKRWVRRGRHGFPGPRLTPGEIKRNYDRILPDPYRGILAESDSLLLTRTQVDSLRSAQRSYMAARDTVLLAFATYLANQGDDYDIKEATRRQLAAFEATTELGHVSVRRVLPTILDKLQLRMLPYPANRLLAAPDDVHGQDALSPR
ncbi:MAG TPA: carboxypeptidase-like regulatory domain-containing protein [Gemmatimonadaceae bacterium]|nr:carboxypeptidase-like regulatory domain-containing protein [Gemmatimonadaceae bacterium]